MKKEDNTWKYGRVTLSSMTYTFKCDNKKCLKTIICILSKYNGDEYFGRCNYCQSGRLKRVQNISLMGILKDQNIIHKKKDVKGE